MQEWKTECQLLKDENRKLGALCDQKELELMKHKSDIQNLTMQLSLWSERKQSNSYHATTSGQISNIVPRLSSHGLPEHRDDSYFGRKLDGLVESISRWARLFSLGQKPLVSKDLSAMRVSDQVNGYISSSFRDIYSLVNAKDVGGKVRIRAIEVILVRRLMGEILWCRHIGFHLLDYESHRNLIEGTYHTGKLHCSNYLSAAEF